MKQIKEFAVLLNFMLGIKKLSLMFVLQVLIRLLLEEMKNYCKSFLNKKGFRNRLRVVMNDKNSLSKMKRKNLIIIKLIRIIFYQVILIMRIIIC